MYSTHYEKKSVFWNLTEQNLQYMNSISKSLYVDQLDDTINECN